MVLIRKDYIYLKLLRIFRLWLDWFDLIIVHTSAKAHLCLRLFSKSRNYTNEVAKLLKLLFICLINDQRLFHKIIYTQDLCLPIINHLPCLSQSDFALIPNFSNQLLQFHFITRRVKFFSCCAFVNKISNIFLHNSEPNG